MKELGRRIRQRRLLLKVSMRALGRHVGKSHQWVANLEDGTMEQPKAEDLTAIATLLGEDPALYLSLAGRVNLKAADVVPGTDVQPAWAVRLEAKIDRLDELLRVVGLNAEGASTSLAQLLAARNPADDHQPGSTPSGSSGQLPVGHRRQKRRPAGGARPSWEEEPEPQSRTS